MRLLRMDTQNWMHRLIEKEGEIWEEFLCFFIICLQLIPLENFIWTFNGYSVMRRATRGKNGCAT
jgi:hypothetical protein